MGLEPHQIENIAVTFITALTVVTLVLLGMGGWSFVALLLMLVTACKRG